MTQTSSRPPVIFTNKAQCRDCYRCLRACPVKAIRMEDGQAFVVEERCIGCGTCIRECPQHAKTFRNDVDAARRILSSGRPVGVSIAPSFVAAFPEWEGSRLPSALRRLGFAYVGETAVGAYHVAQRTAEIVNAASDATHITSACPAAVNYLERHRPDLVGKLTPVASPMVAHARQIKARLGETSAVIFIGPCVAKKLEAERPENVGVVDCVLTFTELIEWLETEEIALSACEESAFDEEPGGHSRFFPVAGGAARTAALQTDILTTAVTCVSGPDDVVSLLDSSNEHVGPTVIEPLFCAHGCIAGPGMPQGGNVYERRRRVLAYADAHRGAEQTTTRPDVSADFTPKPTEHAEFTEAEIRAVLERTGKVNPEDQLNCGACGYGSCREKAIAVLQGMAVVEMCIPYMRRLAEQRSDMIIDTSPNGIVILDEDLTILTMNPAFRKYFLCSEAVCGKPISYLMDPDPFEQVAQGRSDLVEMTVNHDSYSLVCHEVIYPLKDEHQYVGIFVNITNTRANQQALDKLREQTISQAQDLLDHQIHMAQELAKFLGENTARGEELVEKLILLAGNKAGEGNGEASPSQKQAQGRKRGGGRTGGRPEGWPWDTSTSR